VLRRKHFYDNLFFCRKTEEEAIVGEQLYEIDKTMLERTVQQAKTELESEWLVCIAEPMAANSRMFGSFW